MKAKSYLILLISCVTFISCNKELPELTLNENADATELNPNFTFSVLLDFEVWNPAWDKPLNSPFYVNYNEENGLLLIRAFRQIDQRENGEINQSLAIQQHVFETGQYEVDTKYTSFYDSEKCGRYSIPDGATSSLHISKLDKVNKKVSGSFRFELTNEDCSETLQFEKGHFSVDYRVR